MRAWCLVAILGLAGCEGAQEAGQPPASGRSEDAQQAPSRLESTRASQDSRRIAGTEELSEQFEAAQARFRADMVRVDARFRLAMEACAGQEGEARETCEAAAASSHEEDAAAARRWLDEALTELLGKGES